MSLNGLDTPEIHDAYESTLVEAGGWFLVNYTTRDSVALLARGKGGVHEARAAIAQYKEKSPLYGLLIYRRRKVVIKYIPDGTSRLLQARTSVHFTDVSDRFAPYETVLEISAPDGLNDTALAASFPLHTASPAIASNWLQEISEDAESDGFASPKNQSPKSRSSGRVMSGSERQERSRYVDQIMAPSSTILSKPEPAPPATQVMEEQERTPPTTSAPIFGDHATDVIEEQEEPVNVAPPSPKPLPPAPSIQEEAEIENAREESAASLETAPSTIPEQADSRDSLLQAETEQSTPNASQYTFQTSESPRMDRSSALSESTYSARSIDVPSFTTDRLNGKIPDRAASDRQLHPERQKYEDEPFDYSKYDFQPKVKLGPRPVTLEDRSKRSVVSSVSSVPAAYRPTSRRQEPVRPESRDLPAAPAPTIELPPVPSAPSPATKSMPPPPIPESQEHPTRPYSRGSVRSATPSTKTTTMTHDKLRLMKAVELRRRQLRNSNKSATTASPVEQPEKLVVNTVPTAVAQEAQQDPESPVETFSDAPENPVGAGTKADSGVEMEQERQARPKPPVPSYMRVIPGLVTDRSIQDVPSDANNPLTPNAKNNQALVDSPTLGLMGGDINQISIASVVSPQNVQQVPASIVDEEDRPSTPRGPRAQADTNKDDSTAEFQSTDTSPAASFHSPTLMNEDLARRRRGVVDPLQMKSESTENEGLRSSIEALHKSAMQEETPLGVSPVVEEFKEEPNEPSAPAQDDEPPSPVSPISRSSMNADGLSPELANGVETNQPKVSPLVDEKKDDPLIGWNRKVSDGISKRIQTLAEQSSKEGTPNQHPLFQRSKAPEPSMSAFSQIIRKRAARGQPAKAHPNSMGPPEKSNNAQAGAQNENSPVWSVQHDPINNRSSVSVTARIIRPNSGKDLEEVGARDGNFRQSELFINHSRPTSNLQDIPETLNGDGTIDFENKPDAPGPDHRRGSFASLSQTLGRASKDFRNMDSNHGRMFGHRKSSLARIDDDNVSLPPDMVTSGTSFMNWNDENAAPKEGSRTSRFFKRMSTLSTGKRLSKSAGRSPNNTSPLSTGYDRTSIATQSGYFAPPVPEVVTDTQPGPETPPSIMLGNLNVQFADSLLWKHRVVKIDEAGFLMFSMPQATDMQKGVAKKYHLSEMKQPHTPDLDCQELPNSIMFDCLDGTTLQVACEDAAAHRQTMGTLKSYWKAWAGGQ